MGEQGSDRGKKKEHLGVKAKEKAEKREKKMQEKRAAGQQGESTEGECTEAGARNAPAGFGGIEEDGPEDVRDMSEEDFMAWKLQVWQDQPLSTRSFCSQTGKSPTPTSPLHAFPVPCLACGEPDACGCVCRTL